VGLWRRGACELRQEWERCGRRGGSQLGSTLVLLERGVGKHQVRKCERCEQEYDLNCAGEVEVKERYEEMRRCGVSKGARCGESDVGCEWRCERCGEVGGR
jgi:hypothetical protein